MALFELRGERINRIHKSKFKLEKHLQSLVEKNLNEIFGLEFVQTEFSLNNLRIDTLAFDSETKSFVIIEYKRDRSLSVVDQGFAYLSLMLNNKADFILEFNENMKSNLKRENVDWSQSRVIFIADSFTPHQRAAIEFKDLPIELWEVNLFDNDTILFNAIKPADSTESIKTVTKSKTVQAVSKEVKRYTVEDHLAGKPEYIKEIFEALRWRILELEKGEMFEKPVKTYVGYNLPHRAKGHLNVVSLFIFKNKIDLYLQPPFDKIRDSKKRVQKVPESYSWGDICRVSITDIKDIPYAMELIQQSYDFVKKKIKNGN